ncbi:serine/threonine-protein kinase [Actinomadura roseirufa]|uniref:serine/threonine-protein kinase n=1 Tax=Actinomadura roseirufa TaxID=2094049 RepID=UPI0010418BEA|nr:serine/threonine-protein kinase [Actinomadura roseirufa]
MVPLQPGDPDQVGDYRLLHRIGAGGMGQVFYGRSRGGRPVAVKLIRSEYADAEQFRERFAREIEAARLVGGFHTAPVVDADPHADPPWMVTAYIPGPSLQQRVADNGPLSLDAVLDLGAGLAEGLAAIHACGLVHRDLKPSNVILADDGPRIIDFGIARALDAGTMTESGVMLGTYAYMSPEQVHGHTVGPAGDVFALGSVLTFAATGHPPFGTTSAATIIHRITTQPPDLNEVPVAHGLRDLVAGCLAKNPTDRPSVSALLTALTGDRARPRKPVLPAQDPPARRDSRFVHGLRDSGGRSGAAKAGHGSPAPGPTGHANATFPPANKAHRTWSWISHATSPPKGYPPANYQQFHNPYIRPARRWRSSPLTYILAGIAIFLTTSTLISIIQGVSSLMDGFSMPEETSSKVPLPGGTRVFADDFSGKSENWQGYENGKKTRPVGPVNGRLRLTISPDTTVEALPPLSTFLTRDTASDLRIDATLHVDRIPDGASAGILCRVKEKGESYGFVVFVNGVSLLKIGPGTNRTIANATFPVNLVDPHLHAVCANAPDGSVRLKFWIGKDLVLSGRDIKDPIPRGGWFGFRADLSSGFGSESFATALDDVAVYRLDAGSRSPTSSPS